MNFKECVDYLTENQLARVLLADAVHVVEINNPVTELEDMTLDEIWLEALAEARSYELYSGYPEIPQE